MNCKDSIKRECYRDRPKCVTRGFPLFELCDHPCICVVKKVADLATMVVSCITLSYRSLSGNPLRCDCELRWFPAFRDSSIGAVSSVIGSCDVPANLNGAQLRQLSEDQLLCSKSLCSILH